MEAEPRIPGAELTVEPRSSVAIKQNSKGEPAVEVKVYTNDIDGTDAAEAKALEVYQRLVGAVGA